MPLQKQIISLPFTQGLNEKASEKHLTPPSLATCDNGRFTKTGQVQKRNGFSRRTNANFVSGSAGTIDASVQCATYQDEKLIFDGNNAYAQTNTDYWLDKGRITGCTFKDDTVFNNETMTSGPLAAASNDGFRVEAWAETDPNLAGRQATITTVVFHVYARVVEEATGIVVVPKMKITPSAGISVTKAHAQNDDSNYLNPQVQTVVMGDYVFILFCDCQKHSPSITISGTSAGGVGTLITCATAPGLLEGDVVTITGTTSHNGDKIVVKPSASANTFFITDTYSGSSETGTVKLKINYSQETRNGVHAVAVKTSDGIAAALTPTALGGFNSPAFYVNGAYPLFSVSAADNSTTDDTSTPKAAVFRLNTTPISDASATVASYRLDYFEESSGAFIEYLESGFYGYRGRNTPILPSDHTVYFQASESGHSDRERTLSHIALSAIDADDRLMIAATFQETGTATNPQVRTQMYTGALAKVSTTQLAVDTLCLTSGSFIKKTSGTDLHFVWTAQAVTQAANTAVDDGQAADHALFTASVNTGGAIDKSGVVLKRFTTLTSDLFVYNGKVYFAATYAVTPNGNIRDAGGDYVYINYNSSINLISDTDGNIIATGGTGLGGNCASTDWYSNAVDDRTLFWGAARVTSVSASQFCYGSSKFSAVSQGGNSVFQHKSIFNPSYAEIDLSPTRQLENVEGGGSLLLCGGLLWEYAGDVMKENGFLTYPQVSEVVSSYAITAFAAAGTDLIRVTVSSPTPIGYKVGDTVEISGTTNFNYDEYSITAVDTANNTFDTAKAGVFPGTDTGKVQLVGGVLNDGAPSTLNEYNYMVTYEWTNVNGDIQRSYPSGAISATVDGVGTDTTGRVRIRAYTPQWTQKSLANGVSNPNIVLYRTEKGKAAFYRVAAAPVDFETTIQDIDDALVSSSALTDNEPIYSTGAAGDIYGNIAPPCCTDIILHKNRMFLSTIDGAVWYSKKLTPKRGAEFSDFQVKPIENYKSSIACLGSVREYVIVITTENAYLIGGEGPNAAGGGTDFSPPTIFSKDAGAAIGCARTPSPVGFFYNANGGVYRVTPSMQVEWIGAAVEDTVDSYGITRAAVNDTEGEIYFGLDSTTQGILVYNYVFNAWTRWKPTTTVFSNDTKSKGLMVQDGVLNIAIPSGYIINQHTGFSDIGSATSPYTLEIMSAWIRSDQFLHMARFYNILISGTYKSDHTLNCSIHSNYDDSVGDSQSKVITSSTDDPYIFRQHVANQKARSIRLTISDSLATGTREAFQLDGIAVELGVRPGTFKLGTSKTLATEVP